MMLNRSEMNKPKFARGANAEQMEVIMHDDGPLRVLAAAGSGKSKCNVDRIARLVAGGVDPSRILAVTFAKKAADVLNTRLSKLGVTRARVGTWHSLCLQILKEGRSIWSGWTVDGDDDTPPQAKWILKRILGHEVMKWKGADLNKVNSFIGMCKANLITPDSPAAFQMALEYLSPHEAKRAVEAYHRYDETLAEKEILTFDDMLVFAARFLSDETQRQNWAAKWDYVLIDEAQDNCVAQWTIAELLARDHRNYMVTGDLFQAIFSWRGGDARPLAEFEKEWPGAKTIWLGKNYRSGRKILDVANRLIVGKSVYGEPAREMVAARDLDGTVQVIASHTPEVEGQNFVAWIQQNMASAGVTYASFCALVRLKAQTRALEEALLSAKIPYVVIKGQSFYERREVRDLLAYLRVAAERGDVEDVKRCINSPFRFLGAAFVERLVAAAGKGNGKNVNWPRLIIDVSEQARIQQRQSDSAVEWSSMIMDVRDRMNAGDLVRTRLKVENETLQPESEEAIILRKSTPAELLEFIVKQSGYLTWIRKEEGEESLQESGCANVQEMLRVAQRFATAKELLDYIDDTLRRARQQRRDKQSGGVRVTIMTCHAAKGQEMPYVWIAGFNERVFPHLKGDADEEMRLAYVALTRAMDHEVISYVRQHVSKDGTHDAFPSRFLSAAGMREDLPDGEPLLAELEEDPDDEDLAALADTGDLPSNVVELFPRPGSRK